MKIPSVTHVSDISSEDIPRLVVNAQLLSGPIPNYLSLPPEPFGLSCWLGKRLEIVGWGAALRLEFSGRHAIREASWVWKKISERAEVTYEGEGADLNSITWPIALASFGFASFTPGYLVVPESAIVVKRGSEERDQYWFVTTRLEGDTKPIPHIDSLRAQEPTKPMGLWTDPGQMTQGKWLEAVRRLTRMLQSGAASKVVLTRDIVVSASTPIDERYLVKALRRRYPTTWIYSVEGLIGATPEMLASLNQGRFTSRVLAGTSSPGEGDELLASIKNRTEHHLAVESVSRAIAPLSEAMEVPAEPTVLELPNVTHLSTDVKATIIDSNVLDIVDALHPTAAVCGTPTQLAFEILEDIEGTQRGRYSGPVGWIDGDGDGEFGIALRCGQLSEDRNQIRVFAGGGIMPDSVPELELAETRAKMRPVLEALGVEG